jgi:hypothetical protein
VRSEKKEERREKREERRKKPVMATEAHGNTRKYFKY